MALSSLYYFLIILYLKTLFQIRYISFDKCLLYNIILRRRGQVYVAVFIEKFFALYPEYVVCLEIRCTLHI